MAAPSIAAPGIPRPGRLGVRAFLLAALVLFTGAGAVGLYRYVDNFWLYRGYAAPSDPGWVQSHGTLTSLRVASAALGGRRQQVLVYLPPGYAQHPARRYPTLYLLHGVPGRPAAFIQTVRMGVVEDELVARRHAKPLILVMPFGSTGAFTDKEWANGVRPHEGWETFVARDLVRTIDARFRTIRSPRARALAGLSEGGYGALNIGFHHLGTFGVLESWSGYEQADRIRSVFGRSTATLTWNSPALQLARLAPALRRRRTFVWLYTGSDDSFLRQNASFAKSLGAAHVAHRFFTIRGGHNWAAWRGQAVNAYLAASAHLHA
jgi:enterochelin esterase-like enzyme